MTPREWFVSRHEKRIGPFSDAHMLRFIEAGKLLETDLVWRQGLAGWVEASTIAGWFTPPALPGPSTSADIRIPVLEPTSVPDSEPAPEPSNSAPHIDVEEIRPTRDSRPGIEESTANYFARHWRGDLTLGISYWVNGFLLSIAAVFGGALIGQVDMTRQPGLAATLFIIFMAAVALLTFWQLVGIWRAADNHAGRGGSRVWGTLAKIAVVIGVLRFVGETTSTTLPSTIEMVKIASGDSELSSRQIRVLRNASEIEISGSIGFGLTDELVRVLDAHPTARTLHLNSTGGRVLEAHKLRDVIAARELDTYVSHECASACVIAFMGGAERLLGPDGKVGLHSFSMANTSVSSSDYAEDYAFASKRGIDTALLEKGFRTDPSSMWYPTRDELLASRLVTRTASSTEMAFSGGSVGDLQAALDKLSIYRALRTHEPAVYASTVGALRDAMERGNSLADARAITMPLIQGVVQKRLPDASDEVLRDFGKLLVEQLTLIAAKDRELCYNYAFGTSTQESTRAMEILPAEVRARDLDISARIIESSAVPSTKVAMTAAQTEKLFERVGQQMDERHQKALAWLDPGTGRTSAQKAAVCELMINMYSTINALPPNQSAPLLREMMAAERP